MVVNGMGQYSICMSIFVTAIKYWAKNPTGMVYGDGGEASSYVETPKM